MLRNAFLLLLAATCFAILPIFPGKALSQENSGTLPKPLDERLGADDGAAVALLFGGNMRGNLDVCDCNHPRGGLARRVGFVQTYKKKYPEIALVQIEAGFFWYNSESQAVETFLQNDFVTRAYSRWPIDVINLGRYDMFYANRLLLKEEIAEKSAQQPMIKNLISANGVYADNVAAPPPYLIKEVTGPRFKGAKKKLRIGFLGLAEPIRVGQGM